VHALEEIGDLMVIVSEYVEGPTLAEVVATEGPLSGRRWIEMARALAEALAAAHHAHVIHRDVKASNIVLGRDGLRLVDFGIALGQGSGGDTRLTHAGRFIGTPLAQAPEQLEGGPASALSDQYAFGLVLYEAACGQLPFGEGTVAGIWARMLRDDPAPLSARAPQLDPAAVEIVHRCLARRPDDRFASMQDVVAALSVLREGEAIGDGVMRDRGSETGNQRRTSTAPDAGVAENVSVRPSTDAGQDDGLVDLHHAITALLYVALIWPGWLVAGALPRGGRPLAYIALVCTAAVATSLRLHLWFSIRHYPAHVAATRHRLWPVLTVIDVVYALMLGALALNAASDRLVPAVVTAGLAVCLAMASLVIEPATRRATMTPPQ
jgi:hypothetical protein